MFANFGPDEQRWFAQGMLANAVHGARALLRLVDFSPFRRLLDVGGSAGGYAITLVRANPALEATIFDLPDLEPIARETVEHAGLERRITFRAGSFFEDDLPHGHDVLLLSSILHDWGDHDCRVILAHALAALEPGGTVVVTEPMLREDCTGPEHPAVSGLTMAVLGGENRTPQRIAELLEEARFVEPWQSPVGEQNSVVTARKPG
jgi:predicted O-methyltransferase YrrM